MRCYKIANMVVAARGARLLPRLLAKMLREFQCLALIIRADFDAVKHVRQVSHPLIDQAADHLPMFERERGLVAADLEHATRPTSSRRTMPETGVEEAGIMHAEFARDSHVGHHFGRRAGWHADFLAAGKDV